MYPLAGHKPDQIIMVRPRVALVAFFVLSVCAGAAHLRAKPVPERKNFWAQHIYDTPSVSGILKGQTCSGNDYIPSPLEKAFVEHSTEWVDPALSCTDVSTGPNATEFGPYDNTCKSDTKQLCAHLDGPTQQAWIAGIAGKGKLSESIFSKLCVEGQAPALLEPIAGVLRDPRTLCDPSFQNWTHPVRELGKPQPGMWWGSNGPIEFQMWADGSVLKPQSKKIFFDAGCTRFADALEFFVTRYERQGIEFDEIYAWEYEKQAPEAFWDDVDPQVRSKWEPKVHFYNGVPIDAKVGSANNPAELLKQKCRPEDFCAFKLDVDTPSLESDIDVQLTQLPRGVLDEFFQEMAGVKPIGKAYSLFQKLRSNGVRTHGWI